MIGSITRLWDHGEAVAHALAPGDGDQRPRLVARSPDLWPPGDAVQAAELAEALREPLRGSHYEQMPTDRLVWCCTLRQEPGEAPLPDAEWARVAHRIVGAAGLAAEQDSCSGCPWVAIRICDPHTLIVLATLMRADGSRPDLLHAAPRVRALLQILSRSAQPVRAAVSRPVTASALAVPTVQRRSR